MDQRLIELTNWLKDECQLPVDNLKPVAGGASFRRYFRLFSGHDSWIVMDAPPGRESVADFIAMNVHREAGDERDVHQELGDRTRVGRRTEVVLVVRNVFRNFQRVAADGSKRRREFLATVVGHLVASRGALPARPHPAPPCSGASPPAVTEETATILRISS